MTVEVDQAETARAPSPGERADRERVLTRRAVIGSVVVLVLVCWYSAQGTVQPLIYADEAGYLLNARYLALLGEPSGTSYYPGYSLLLIPSFLVSADFDVTFRLVQVTNVALVVASFALLRAVVMRLVPSTGPVRASLVACVTLLYPAWANDSALALSENLLLPALLGVWWLTLRAEESGEVRAIALAGLSAGLITGVHPRANVVALAFALVAVAATWIGRWDRRGLVGAALGLGAGVVAARLLLVLARIESDNTGNLVETVTSASGLRQVLVTLDGHGLYLLVATGGLALVGILVLARPSGALPLTRSVILLALLGSWLLAATFMAGGVTDKLIYGRYNEPFFVVALAVGLAAVVAEGLRLRVAAAVAVLVVLAAGFLAWQTEQADVAGSFNRSNVFALLPLLRRSDPSVDWKALAAVGVVGVAVVWLLAARRATRGLLLVVLAVVFVWVGVDNAHATLHPDSALRRQQGSLADRLVAIEGGEGPACVSVDRRELSQWHRFNYRVRLPRTDVNEVLATDDPSLAACGPYLLSSVVEIPDDVPGARVAAHEAYAGISLWVLPGDEQDALDARGELFPPGWEGPIPAEARSADLEVVSDVGIDDLARGAELDLTVRHTGRGSPWPGQSGIGGRFSAPVRVVATVLGPSGRRLAEQARVDVPATVVPGEAFDVVLELPPIDLDRLGEADEITIHLELVQEGVAWFGSEGSLDLVVE